MSDTSEQTPKGVQAIDYLSKDWSSFRRLLLERISAIAPDAATGNAADPATVLCELLAYAADQASYYQDAVATEAYLGTARLRTSVRRHARLLDYPVHDGANARAWVAVVIGESVNRKLLPAGTVLCTRVEGQQAVLESSDLAAMRARGALIFETMHDLLLRRAHNRIPFAVLPGDAAQVAAGTTSVTLRDDQVDKAGQRDALALAIGDVLVLEERATDAPVALQATRVVSGDPQRRHAVRITALESGTSAAGIPIVTVSWATEDALPFPLTRARACAVGNVVLADHGYTLPQPEAIETEACRHFTFAHRRARPRLQKGPLTFRSLVLASGRAQPFDPSASASAAIPDTLSPERLIEPAIWLTDASGASWSARRDLLGSSAHAYDFVVETEDDGSTFLRFGNGVYGRWPESDMQARYRIGNGSTGNVGAEAIYHIISDSLDLRPGLLFVRNPLPARGGVDPESIEHVKLHAPQKFHQQERVVTVKDYAQLVRSFPTVCDALVERRDTGSYITLVISVLRRDGAEVDEDFRARLTSFLDRYRMAGQAVSIRGAVRVPLDIKLAVDLAPGHSRTAVLSSLSAALGPGSVQSGARRTLGFFHQDRVELGKPVYLSRLITAAMGVSGVLGVEPVRFGRYGGPSQIGSGVIPMRSVEVPAVENRIDAPQRGRIEIVLQGGTSS